MLARHLPYYYSMCSPLKVTEKALESFKEGVVTASLGGQSIGVSASASVLPMNTQD